jgi:hypothetical protein
MSVLQQVQVLNINDLANALRTIVLPGEGLNVTIIKIGREQGQGIAYLDDGTMVVVDGASRMVGKTVMVEVTTSLQTSAGRMIFAKIVIKEGMFMAESFRIGSGFDVHAYGENRKMILCNVEIPSPVGLIGHSDADAALHALCDALLVQRPWEISAFISPIPMKRTVTLTVPFC